MIIGSYICSLVLTAFGSPQEIRCFYTCSTMAPKLEQVFKVRAFLSKSDMLPLGSIKGGPHRIVVPVESGGFLEGADFKAEFTAGGSDWLLFDPATGVAQLDIRANARTEGGEYICELLDMQGFWSWVNQSPKSHLLTYRV